MFTAEMFSSHPQKATSDTTALAACIAACAACEQACISCADACLAEPKVDELRTCIRLNLDCADICGTTVRMFSRLTSPDGELVRSQAELLALVCRKCGDECGKHAGMHEHCRICADACRACEQACSKYLSTLPQ